MIALELRTIMTKFRYVCFVLMWLGSFEWENLFADCS